jgi:hypothetical protein
LKARIEAKIVVDLGVPDRGSEIQYQGPAATSPLYHDWIIGSTEQQITNLGRIPTTMEPQHTTVTQYSLLASFC